MGVFVRVCVREREQEIEREQEQRERELGLKIRKTHKIVFEFTTTWGRECVQEKHHMSAYIWYMMRHNNDCWMIEEMTTFMHSGTKCMFQLQQFAQKIELCQILNTRMEYISAGLFITSGRLWMKVFEKCNLDRFFFFFWRWNTLKGWKYVNVSVLTQEPFFMSKQQPLL